MCFVGGLRKCEGAVEDLLAPEIYVEERRKRLVLMSVRQCTILVGALRICVSYHLRVHCRLELGVDGRDHIYR